jgi:putative spermidine/putrescine transport system substrate-binding protein
MKDFTKKYGINITDANPNGSSGDEVAAVQANEGTRGPDVVDVGLTHAAPYDSLWSDYEVSTWNAAPQR